MKRTPNDRKCLILLGLMGLGLARAGSAGEGEQAPTFYKDVLPVFQNRCIECHRQGQLAPMTLDSYEAARPYAKSILKSVVEREMPPWDASPEHGKFLNDASLSEAEIKLVADWAKSGAPAGDPGQAPPAKEFASDWKIGEPDALFRMPEAYALPAEGPDEYKYFRVPTNFTEDRWISAMECKAGNAEVVHHIIVFVKEPGKPLMHEGDGEGGAVEKRSKRPESEEDLQKIMAGQERAKQSREKRGRREQALRDTGMLGGVAPGMPPWVARPGEGRLVKAGSELVFQMHYHPSGKPALDQSVIGVKFAEKPAEHHRRTTGIFNIGFAIPPGADNFEVVAEHTLRDDIHLVSFMPHMHLRGKAYEYKAIYPNGAEEILLSVPRYDFAWQNVYELAEPKALPRGTTIVCTAHFDNSASNPDNPDPQAVVRFGEPTVDEMMIGWFDYWRDSEPSALEQAEENPEKLG